MLVIDIINLRQHQSEEITVFNPHIWSYLVYTGPILQSVRTTDEKGRKGTRDTVCKGTVSEDFLPLLLSCCVLKQIKQGLCTYKNVEWAICMLFMGTKFQKKDLRKCWLLNFDC